MKRFLPIPSLLLCLPSLKAQNNGIEQSSELTTAPTGETIFRWDGKAGRSYFIQISDATNHLAIWNWAPVIESGNDEEISYEVDATADKGFFRLQYTDQPILPGETPDTADFDGDGLTNLAEITPIIIGNKSTQTNPLDPDADHDGLPDKWERDNGFDPTDNGSINPDNGSNGDPDGDGVSNIIEYQNGTNANNDNDFPLHMITAERCEYGKGLTVAAQDSWAFYNLYDWSANLPTQTNEDHFSLDLMVEKLQDLPYPQTPGVPAAGFIRNLAMSTGIYSASSTASDGSISDATLTQQGVWLKAPPLPILREYKFLKVTEKKNLTIAQPSDPNVTVEAVTIQILPNQTCSEPYELSGLPEMVTGSQMQAYCRLLPVEVSWKAIDGFDNVDDHIDPWSKPIYGKRIFPEFKNPDDTEIRHKLEVIVKTSPALFGKTVYVKSFDVDDSTSEDFDLDENGTSPVIDTNGKAGNDNLVDYLSNPQNGQFWTGSAWGGQTAQGTVDANGETKFIFRVGMQPGSNYRVVASVIDEAMYAGVQTSDPAAPKYLGPEASQNGGTAASPLLTVWRRLWVENDSMEAIPMNANGYNRNDLGSDLISPAITNLSYSPTTERTSFGIDFISDQSSFLNLENGRFIAASFEHSVIDTRSYQVTVAGNHGNVPIGSGYRLYDDDDFGLNRAPLPRNDLIDDTFKNVYKPAFIEVVDAANFKGQDYNPSKTVDFYRNHPVMVGPWGFQSPGVWDDAINLTDSKPLWVGNLIAGYQGEVGDDRDPSSEGLMEGITPGSRRYSIVYVENVRDQNDAVIRNASTDNTAMNSEIARNIKLTAAHEIGHMPGGGDETSHHAENMLMDEDGYGSDNGLKFSPKSILRFRKTNQWQQP